MLYANVPRHTSKVMVQKSTKVMRFGVLFNERNPTRTDTSAMPMPMIEKRLLRMYMLSLAAPGARDVTIQNVAMLQMMTAKLMKIARMGWSRLTGLVESNSPSPLRPSSWDSSNMRAVYIRFYRPTCKKMTFKRSYGTIWLMSPVRKLIGSIVSVHIGVWLVWWVMVVIIFGFIHFGLEGAAFRNPLDARENLLSSLSLSVHIATASYVALPTEQGVHIIVTIQQLISLLFVSIFLLKIVFFVRRGLKEPMREWK